MMNKPRVLLTVCLQLLCVSAMSGCLVEERSFSIVQNQVPTTGCIVEGNESKLYRPRGLLDVSVGLGYWMYPLIKNDLIATQTDDKQPERNRLVLTGFEVELDVSELPGTFPPEVTQFSQSVSGTLVPNATVASTVEIIPAGFVRRLSIPPNFQPVVTAAVRAVADHNGGELRSKTFRYPVELCNGCLVVRAATCPTVEDAGKAVKNICGLPQDAPTTCCTNTNRQTVCLAK